MGRGQASEASSLNVSSGWAEYNPAKGFNVTCPVSGELTIRQLHLSEIDESVYMKAAPDGSSSQGLIEVDKNIRQAHQYLEKHQITVPW